MNKLKKVGIAAGIILTGLILTVFCMTSCAIHIKGTKPVQKNDAWTELFNSPINFDVWEKERIKEIGGLL